MFLGACAWTPAQTWGFRAARHLHFPTRMPSTHSLYNDVLHVMSLHHTQRAIQGLYARNLKDCRKWLKGAPEFSLTVLIAAFCFKCWLKNIPHPSTGALTTTASNSTSSGEASPS